MERKYEWSPPAATAVADAGCAVDAAAPGDDASDAVDTVAAGPSAAPPLF